MRRSLLAAALLLALAGCKDKQADGPIAPGGEVLPGSASDAMIRYDTRRSQPPLAIDQPEGTNDRATASDAAPGDEASVDASEAATPETIASEPAG